MPPRIAAAPTLDPASSHITRATFVAALSDQPPLTCFVSQMTFPYPSLHSDRTHGPCVCDNHHGDLCHPGASPYLLCPSPCPDLFPYPYLLLCPSLFPSHDPYPFHHGAFSLAILVVGANLSPSPASFQVPQTIPALTASLCHDSHLLHSADQTLHHPHSLIAPLLLLLLHPSHPCLGLATSQPRQHPYHLLSQRRLGSHEERPRVGMAASVLGTVNHQARQEIPQTHHPSFP